MNKFAVFAVVLLVAGFSCGSPVSSQNTNDGNEVLKPFVIREDELIQKLNSKCATKDVSSCVMLKLVTYMNRLMKKNNLELGETIEIAKKDNAQVEDEQTVEVVQVDSARGYSDESVFSEVMADKLWKYVKSRSLKVKLLPEADFVVSAAEQGGTLNFGMSVKTGELETGRGKNKNMGPMMAAVMMKLGMLKILAFKALALLVGKALLVSKLAFLLATIIGLKKLFSQQKHVTYEVVAHPHHSHGAVESHGDSYSAGWGRSSSEAAHSLAYGGQAQ
ncbi:uncharacterized protein LOC126843582 [Adelges cooleyi]|uniref:uncharacterized protein LOC126843582 n=1 Tax=Adelges cooleyi TaxID=133065 RepID=UPI0021802FA2|nr:uncharacterized protein LOC126843582 [Adelges cooleyi]XP_050437150.1 uncharacterized protein LOC126843582 [Adelges cooleyi]